VCSDSKELIPNVYECAIFEWRSKQASKQANKQAKQQLMAAGLNRGCESESFPPFFLAIG